MRLFLIIVKVGKPSLFLIFEQPQGELIYILTYVPLLTSEVGHRFRHLLAVFLLPFVGILFMSLVYFSYQFGPLKCYFCVINICPFYVPYTACIFRYQGQASHLSSYYMLQLLSPTYFSFETFCIFLLLFIKEASLFF